MTDDQFERIKKGLNFHSEGGVYNLCTLTETALREIIEDAIKFYEKQQKIDAEQIRALQKQNGELTDKVKELEAQIEKMKNCKNCKKLKKEKDGLLFCTVGSFYTNAFGKNCDNWEIKENGRNKN